MACSKEEIENKRLAALEKIRSRTSLNGNNMNFSQTTVPKYPTSIGTQNQSNSVGPIFQSSLNKNKFQPYGRTSQSNTQAVASKVVSGTTYLISENRFEVKPSEFNEQMIQIFKTISSKSYDAEKRLWNFSLDQYEELHKKILQLKPHVVLGAIPSYVLYVMREPIHHIQFNISKIEPTLKNKLMQFQIDGVRFGIEKNGRCMIADDMGLGKTFQALAIAHYYINDWPLLIVTTSSMRETWESKIHELLPSIPMANIICISSGKEKQFLVDRQSRIVIISYKMTTLCTDILIEKKFGAVILDESHLLKSYKAQSTECIMKITKHARRVILLSGTPALSRPSELYTQLQIIEPKFFQGFTEYGIRYCAGKQTNFGWDMTGQSNLTELQVLLQKKFLIRRTKEQVLTNLQEKTREAVILDSSLLCLNENTKDCLSQLANTINKKKAADRHAALLSFFSESARVKLPAICKYVAEVASSEEKYLVFAHHRNVLEAICLTLDENRIHYICIDGSTKSEHRNVLVDKFQFNDSCRCAVLSITAANAGITLTAAQLVLFAELHWNPGIITQAEARAHRIGQQGGVRVKYLIAKGTSDDYMWPMLQEKLQVLNKVGLSKDTFENTTLTTQTSENSIQNYFNPQKNSNSFIPGTNIIKGTERKSNNNGECSKINVSSPSIECSFFEDDEGDELLANFNL